MPSPLAPYHHTILKMDRAGASPETIAAWIYDLLGKTGPINPNYRDVDTRFILGLVDRFLTGRATAEAERLAAEVRDLERQVRARQLEEEARERAREWTAHQKLKKAARDLKKEQARQEQEEMQRQADERRRLRLELMHSFPAWHGRDWSGLLPPSLAIQQAAWDRHMAALRMRRAGLTLEECAGRLRVNGRERARQIVAKAERILRHPAPRSPLERYLAELPTCDGRDDQYQSDLSRKYAGRFLGTVEVLTGRATVPPCTAAERRIWELYYALREDA